MGQLLPAVRCCSVHLTPAGPNADQPHHHRRCNSNCRICTTPYTDQPAPCSVPPALWPGSLPCGTVVPRICQPAALLRARVRRRPALSHRHRPLRIAGPPHQRRHGEHVCRVGVLAGLAWVGQRCVLHGGLRRRRHAQRVRPDGQRRPPHCGSVCLAAQAASVANVCLQRVRRGRWEIARPVTSGRCWG